MMVPRRAWHSPVFWWIALPLAMAGWTAGIVVVARGPTGADEAVEVLEKHEAWLLRDAKSPGKPIRGVQVTSPKHVREDIEQSSRLPDLQALTVWGLRDADMDCLALLPGLLELNLRSAPVFGPGLIHLKGMNRLKALDLGSTRLTDGSLAIVAALTSLETLRIDRSPLTDAGLADLGNGLAPRLRVVSIAETSVGDAGLASLARIETLETLNLAGTRVTDAGLAHLAGLTRLRDLNLRNTRVGDAGLAHLARLVGLRSVVLGATRVTDAGLARLARHTELRILSLSGLEGVTDVGLAHVSGLDNLETLHLSGTRVSDAGLARLSRLTRLRLLYINGTPATETGLDQLQKALPDLVILPAR